MRLHPRHISRHGIDCTFHTIRSPLGSLWGDDVLWMWPWKRYGFKGAWISFGFDAMYASLSEIEQEWFGYERALAKVSNEN